MLLTGRKNGQDARWLQQVRKSGTTSDKVAALTLLLQESAVANLRSLDALLNWVLKRKGGRNVVAQVHMLWSQCFDAWWTTLFYCEYGPPLVLLVQEIHLPIQITQAAVHRVLQLPDETAARSATKCLLAVVLWLHHNALVNHPSMLCT